MHYNKHTGQALILLPNHVWPMQLAPGVKAIQVRDVQVHDFSTACFHLIRPDGSAEDFSTRKCLCQLFPGFGASPKMVSV